MLRRVLVGTAVLAVALTCFAIDASGRAFGDPAWCAALLGAALTVGALVECIRLGAGRPAHAADAADAARAGGAGGAEPGGAAAGRRGALAVGLAIGLPWLGVHAAAGLVPQGGWDAASTVLAGVSAGVGLLLAARIPRGADAYVARLSRRAWFAPAYVGGLGCLVRLALGGAFELAVGVVLVAKSSDIGAYFTGRTFGRRPLAPRVSPKKTVEGAVGGVVVPVLLGAWLLWSVTWSQPCEQVGGDVVVLAPQTLPRTGPAAAALAAAVAVLAIVSDLTESLLKRAAGVKDSGRLFGESGGWLDLADSLILVGPLALAYTALAG